MVGLGGVVRPIHNQPEFFEFPAGLAKRVLLPHLAPSQASSSGFAPGVFPLRRLPLGGGDTGSDLRQRLGGRRLGR